MLASLINSSTYAESRVNEKCFSGESHQQCYTLYGSESSSITWNVAHDECVRQGSNLVMITSLNIQNKLLEVIQPIRDTGGEKHIWAAGKRSGDSKWYQVNNASVTQGLAYVIMVIYLK